MGTTPSRRLRPVAAAALAAALVTAAAAPALAATVYRDRMPVTSPTSTSPTRVLGPAVVAATTATGTPASWSTPVRRTTRSTVLDPSVAEVLRLVNVARAKAGCAAVRWDSRLGTAARLHSEDMARRSYFSHTSLDGRTPWDRMRAQGYTDGSGENIAAGYATPAAVMTAWMNSTGHRANILACSSRALGIGIGRGGSYGIYWTQDFGRA